MALTFGGTAGDDVNWTLAHVWGTSSRAGILCGWWRPTTLTATRKLWSVGNNGVFGAEINSTTSELRLKTNNSTDGQWTTTGVGLATDEWKFLAFFNTTLNGTPSAAWRVWAGSIDSAPVECTVTVATSPSGNFNGSTSFYLGNAGTGSLAFQGDIGSGRVASTTLVEATTNMFGIAAAGACTDTEAQFIYERFVLPAWRGQPWNVVGSPYVGATYNSSTNISMYMWDFDRSPLITSVFQYQNADANTGPWVIPTTAVAGGSTVGTPRPMTHIALHPDAYMGQGF